MECYQFTGSLSAVCWCAYMMNWLLGFSCDVGERHADSKGNAEVARGQTAAVCVQKMYELFKITDFSW